MKVLIAHSWYSTGPASGENRVVQDEAQLLRQAGHDVKVWTPAPTDGDLRGLGLAKTGARAVWSRRATASLEEMMSPDPPDIVHFHNLFPELSPRALEVAARHSAVVMTLHNYRLMCLSADFFRDGKTCELCLGKSPLQGVRYRCYRGSSLGSAAIAASLMLHRQMRTFEYVDRFLPVSDFVKSKYVAGGWDPNALSVKPNFSWPSTRRQSPHGDLLFLGRLSQEKGLGPLLARWEETGKRLRVVGDGPAAESWRSLATGDTTFVGQVSPDEAKDHLVSASALVLPSAWYEGAPRSILEAFAAGVPVIGTNIGGIAELITHGTNGLLVDPGSIDGWIAAVGSLDSERSVTLGRGAFETWDRDYSPQAGLRNLERIYSEVASSSSRRYSG